MAEIKLNKTELKAQNNLLDQLTKYLPTLQLKKQQLQAEIENMKTIVNEKQNKMDQQKNMIAGWAELLSEKLTVNIHDFIEIKELKTEIENIAGVDVPRFIDLDFIERDHYYFTIPVWFDGTVRELRKLILLREQVKIAKARIAAVEEELRQTSIKVNLFEKRMIPQCRENIRKIKIFLGDQEIAALCNAKIAKDKLKRKEELQAAEAI